MEEPKMRWSDWLDVSKMPGAIVPATIGGMVVTLLIEGLHYLIT